MRKLLPAVYNLNVDGVLPSNFAIVGFGMGGETGDPTEWLRRGLAKALRGFRASRSTKAIGRITRGASSM